MKKYRGWIICLIALFAIFSAAMALVFLTRGAALMTAVFV